MKLKIYLLSLLGILLFCNNDANAQQFPTELVGYYKSTSGNSDFIGLQSDGFGKMNIAGFTSKTIDIAWEKRGNDLIAIAYDPDISAVLCSWQKKGNGIILNFPVPMGRSLTFTRGDVNAGSSNNNSGQTIKNNTSSQQKTTTRGNSQLPPALIQTVAIGKQIWMAKNLDAANFRNGDHIPEAKTEEEWREAAKNKQPAWCYKENLASNGKEYGKLYNWYAVNDPRGLAPIGYHIPTDDEWTILTMYLGGDSVAGTKMKSTSVWSDYRQRCSNCASWNQQYKKNIPCHICKDTREIISLGVGTNLSGFSGLPGGLKSEVYGGFWWNERGDWWSSNENDMNTAWIRELTITNGKVNRYSFPKACGVSVRCLRD